MESVMQLGYLGIGVKDMEAWKDYATGVLGMQPNGETERQSLFLRTDDYHHRFELYPTGEDDLIYAGWEVKSADALRAVADQVRSYGIEVTECTREDADERMVLGLIRFNDPDGLQTEVYYGPMLDTTQFNSPRGISRFVTGENGSLGLGHIVIHVGDVNHTLDFYVNAMGVKISDFIDMNMRGNEYRFAFAHANGRHHSIALIPKMEMAGEKRMDHFMVEVDSLDDVGRTLSIFRQRDLPAGAIGRHTNDHMVSFYAPTPSGFQVEYGWGARLVDDSNWSVSRYTMTNIWGGGRAQPIPAGLPPQAAEGAPVAGAR